MCDIIHVKKGFPDPIKEERAMKSMANWITSPRNAGEAAFTYRKDFIPAKAVKKATLCASAIGVYALWINGTRVGKGVLTPGWTSYAHRVQYQTYDVTDLLTANTRIELGVGQGWAVGYIGYANTNHFLPFIFLPSLG